MYTHKALLYTELCSYASMFKVFADLFMSEEASFQMLCFFSMLKDKQNFTTYAAVCYIQPKKLIK